VVVVSPLIALMQDQQEKLAELNINAAKLNSTLSSADERQTTAEIERGEHPLIYVTPERLEDPAYVALLARQSVALFVVDEAHCISQWGHDFRPAFLALRDAARDLGRPPILALTATATDDVLQDIALQLDMREPRLVNTGIERPNLAFEVLRAPSTAVKQAKLLALLQASHGVGILYVATIRVANEIARWLEQQGIHVGLYHGKLATRRREEIQRRFMNDEFPVLVATSAFGMGVDKPNLRFIAHYNFPLSLEVYFQEAGRAGRDGQPARISLLYRLEDKRIQSFFLGGKYPRRDKSTRVVDALQRLVREQPARAQGFSVAELSRAAELSARACRVINAQLENAGIMDRKRGFVRLLRPIADAAELDAILREYEARHRDDRERLETMMRYAQIASCRVRFIREYFGEPAGYDCGHCDNCEAHAHGKPAAGLA
jgi:ATP-dependent DNA helicase RecQ